MGYRSTYNRRLRASKRLQKRLAAAALLGVAVCAAALLLPRQQGTPGASQVAAADTAAVPQTGRLAAPAAQAGVRRIYPYSIVPGGVSGRAELVHVLQTDRVVAQHYAGFQVDKTSAVTVSKPRAVYVSYRKGDKVFWTSKKLMLAQGETLLSDGSNEIRTRCGNRISDVPRMPVEAAEPSAEVLDTAMDASMDEAGDGQLAAASMADGLPAAGQSTAASAHAGTAPALGRAPVALAMLGLSGSWGSAAPINRPTILAAAPVTAVRTQKGVSSDSNVPSATPGTASGTGTSSGGASADPGIDTGAGIVSTGGASGTPGTPSTPTPVLGPVTDPAEGSKPELPPLPDTLSPSGAPPVVVGKTPAKASPVPEPGSLWLSGVALAAMLLLRRTLRRRSGRG
jgi:hypothetical protein